MQLLYVESTLDAHHYLIELFKRWYIPLEFGTKNHKQYS